MKQNGQFERSATELMGHLHGLARRFIHQYRGSGHDGSLTRLEMIVVEAMDGKRTLTMSELARAVELTLSGLTAVVDKLVAKELLARGRSDEDRRVVWVRLTAAGRKVCVQRQRRRLRMSQAMLGSLSASEQLQFLELMRKIGGQLASDVNDSKKIK
jgi:DNA-binding MarR family transcriptional regulator